MLIVGLDLLSFLVSWKVATGMIICTCNKPLLGGNIDWFQMYIAWGCYLLFAHMISDDTVILSLYLSVCLPVCLSLSLSLALSLSSSLPLFLFLYNMSTRISVYLFLCPSVCPFMCLPAFLVMSPSV